MSSELRKIPATSFLMIALVVLPLFVTGSPNVAYKDSRSPMERIGMADPAAVYCFDLGYQYEIIDTDGGQVGICIFPDGSKCDAWQFLEGKCGQDYSYCAKQGYDMILKADGNNPFSREYAVCLDGGKEIGSITALTNLEEKTVRSSFFLEESSFDQEEIVSQTSFPSAFDWRNKDGKNWMTPSKFQGMCGACWAFAAVGVTEAIYNIAINAPDLDLDLSEQMLVSDCYYEDNCCGGMSNKALEYIKDYGIVDEACFEYVDKTCSCSNGCEAIFCTYYTNGDCSNSICSDKCSDWEDRLHFVTDHGYVSPSDIKEKLIEIGPLSVSIGWGEKYGGYWDGDIYRCERDTGLNHAIVLVGYDDAGGYWIAKNSWGTGFGDDGCFKVGYGECRIEDRAYYALHNVSCQGDVTGPEEVRDGIVDMRDIGFAARALGTYQGHPRWNPVCDIIDDGYVDIKDLLTIARRIGKDCVITRLR